MKEPAYCALCGLHIHVSRGAFGNTETRQDAVIACILFFVEKHWKELLKFSRRTQSQLQRWAARYVYKEQPKDIFDHIEFAKPRKDFLCPCLMLSGRGGLQPVL